MIPGWERSPGEENGNPLQYSCLGNPMDRGAWRALCIGVQLITSVVIVSHRQQRDSATHIHVSILLSHPGCRMILSRVPCACMLSWFSRVRLFATLWTIVRQSPLSKGFSRQEYWSRLPFPAPGDLPDPEMELASLLSPGRRTLYQ